MNHNEIYGYKRKQILKGQFNEIFDTFINKKTLPEGPGKTDLAETFVFTKIFAKKVLR